MSDEPYTIIIDGNGNVQERKIGNHYEGQMLSPSVSIESNSAIDGQRTVFISRSFKGKT